MIIKRMSSEQSVNELVKYERFSREACVALIEHLEQEEDNVDFDPIAWSVDWREYQSLQTAYRDLAWTVGGGNTDIDEESARAWFNDRTTIIEFDGGVLVNMNF